MSGGTTLRQWDGQDLRDLLALEAVSPTHWRNRCGDANTHGSAYGGQLLAQALTAAAGTAPAGRPPTMMQFLFLQSARHDEPIDFHVTPLQDGKRFSSRHVRGTQRGSRAVLDAQVSFSVPFDAPSHGAPPPADWGGETDPAALPTVHELPRDFGERVRRTVGYEFFEKASIDFRMVLPPGITALPLPEPRLRFWLRLTHPIGDEPALHAAAFAYLSDWWLNFPASGGHLDALDGTPGLYVASLNHALWLHRPFRADEWLHIESVSPAAAGGRGLSVARVHDRAGRLVASVTQECLMAPLPA